jgi:hypothetical protein
MDDQSFRSTMSRTQRMPRNSYLKHPLTEQEDTNQALILFDA